MPSRIARRATAISRSAQRHYSLARRRGAEWAADNRYYRRRGDRLGRRRHLGWLRVADHVDDLDADSGFLGDDRQHLYLKFGRGPRIQRLDRRQILRSVARDTAIRLSAGDRRYGTGSPGRGSPDFTARRVGTRCTVAVPPSSGLGQAADPEPIIGRPNRTFQ
jgi:hypothetical protein